MKFVCFLLVSFYSTVSMAEEYVSGVSTEAISMPSLPGSVEGLPHTINESESKGQFGFDIPIKAPKGINGHTPDIRISYSSAAGQSEFGQGWSINIPTIGMDTKRGVPTYSAEDIYWGPDGELVKLTKEGDGTHFYSAYINKKQNLYEFDDSNKTWIIHQGDGKKLYFGLNEVSMITEGSKVFKWFLEKSLDPVGNEIVYEYVKDNGQPYISKIKYANKDDSYHYSIDFIYGAREDVLKSFKSSFLVTQSKLCTEIQIKSDDSFIVRSYELLYETQSESKLSLLSEIRQHGENGDDLVPPMPPIKFTYSGISLNQNFETKKLDFSDTEVFPPSLNKSRATIVDINRDSFPDILETSRYGAKVWLNNGNDGFLEHYLIPEFIGVLGEGQSKLLDVDGDRVVDFLATGLYPKYYKGGVLTSSGQLGFAGIPNDIVSIPRYSIGSDNVKTLDLNADGRLDILAREVDGFKTYLSTSSGNWNKAQDYNVNTGAFDLSSPYTFFSDINGDGLTDLVFVRESHVIYLPNRGDGIFSDPISLNFNENSPLILKLFKLNKYNFIIDINGDGYGDLVTATGTNVAISLNQGDETFGDTLLLNGIHGDEFDLKGLHITTADLNGNNTTDILWTNDFHDWRYLDFSDGKLNLLTKIDNGMGLKTHIGYEWASYFGTHPESDMTILPYPMVVVKSITETLGNNPSLIKEDQYKYFGGFYHANENDFRGFNLVEKIEVGDSSIDSSYVLTSYEQGRLNNKDHQQLMLRKRSEYEYNLSKNALGNLLKEEEYSLATLDTFATISAKQAGLPYAGVTLITEGDSDPLTSNRQHKIERIITLSEEGFVQKDKTITYLDLVQILRQDEKVLAINDIENFHITNRVCEQSIYDPSNTVIERTRYYYDNESNLCTLSSGLLTKKDVWTGVGYETKNTYTYNSFGSLASYTDSLSHTTSITYDSLNINPVSVFNAASHLKQATYNSNNGLMDSFTDENGLTTHFYHDLYQRLIKVVGPADTFSLPTEEAIYTFGNSSGDLSSITTKKREKSGVSGTFDTKEYFDGKGRSNFKITEGITDKYVLDGASYNSRGEKHKILQKSFVSSFVIPGSTSAVKYFETRYDTLKRPILVFNPEHSETVPSYKEYYYLVGETVSYDEERKVSYEYKDSVGRRIGHKDALENETIYEFDSRDLMTKIIDPKSAETLFTYDSQKRRTCKLDPVTGVTNYSYNSENLVIQKDMYGFVSSHSTCSVPTGVTPRNVQFEYNDNLNRMTKMDFPIGSSTEDLIYRYDELASTYPKGRLTSVDFGIGEKKIDYDIYGNQSKTTLTVGVSSYLTEKKFDVLGRVEEIVYPTIGSNSLGIKYGFDASSQLIEAKDSGTSFIYANGLTYSPLNQVETLDFGNNTKTIMSYDEAEQSYRLVNILTEKLGTPNTTIQNIDYEYDKVSNIIGRDDIQNSFTEAYNFDDLHRILSANLGGASKAWSFDEIGNITSNNGISYTYASGRDQVIATVGPTSYSFDVFGNLTQDASRTYVFDWNNRLRSVTKSSQTTTYGYGEDGLRVIKATPSQTTIFIDKYTELRGSDVVRHIYANDKLIASVDELNNVTYNHSDHLGSSNLKTDATGNVVKRIEYVPFGDKRVEVGSYNNIKNRFTNQYEDEETGLYYYKKRYYDPILSRFISADPLYLEEMDQRGKNSQELNLYAYVKNNPLKYIDETGESPLMPPALAAGAVTFAGTVVYSLASGDSFKDAATKGAFAGASVFTAVATGGAVAAFGTGLGVSSAGAIFSGGVVGASVGGGIGMVGTAMTSDSGTGLASYLAGKMPVSTPAAGAMSVSNMSGYAGGVATGLYGFAFGLIPTAMDQKASMENNSTSSPSNDSTIVNDSMMNSSSETLSGTNTSEISP